MAKSSRAPARDDYLELVMRCPLRQIKTAAQYGEAAAMLDALVLRKLTPGEHDYLDALTTLVEAYDREHAGAGPKSPPLDLLREMMGQSGMSTTALGRLFGSKGVASEVLNGKRELNLNQIYKLAGHFNVPPATFLRT